MKKGEKIYRALRKQGLTNKEIAEAYILPHDLTKKEKAQSDKDLFDIIKTQREKVKGLYVIRCNRCDCGKSVRESGLTLMGTKCTFCKNGAFVVISSFTPIKK